MTAPRIPAGGWHDLHRLADALEQVGDITGDLPLGDLSETTTDGIRAGRRFTAAFVSVLRQAAREERVGLNLRVGLSRMDPDKRREHALDELRDRMDDDPNRGVA